VPVSKLFAVMCVYSLWVVGLEQLMSIQSSEYKLCKNIKSPQVMNLGALNSFRWIVIW
jgi:hypothetical protein